ncbi:permease-like cell division protein FtsX [Streptosporangium subroseum]|uniref:permease-like cell division protein FtsX n=1 Tax=Streptosporangium subroseum TaxID=106412 RepID=UPI00308A14C0|nr:permease-like cell division protein FtsX [Streptosporangium subroseum]
MSIIEDRLRDAMAARAEAVPDDDRPLPAPRARRARRTAPIAIAAAVLLVAGTAFGAVRLGEPSPGSPETVVAMSMGGSKPSDPPEVRVFPCKGADPWQNCEGAATEAEKEEIRRMLEARPEVEAVVFRDQRTNWESFRSENKDNATLLRVIAVEDMPESFTALIRPDADSLAVARAAGELPGVANAIDKDCLFGRLSLLSRIESKLPWAEPEKQCSYPEYPVPPDSD